MKSLLYILLTILFLGCNSENKVENTTDRKERISNRKSMIDSINHSLNWQKTSYDLWKSKNGDLAIQTQEATEENINTEVYITEMWRDDENFIPINQVVDTLTFRYLGSSFYKDKNLVYTHYVMSDGGNFQVVKEADSETFQVIGDCYAKDKNYIFGERAMKMDSVDYSTFKTAKGLGCHAKDKNAYFFWDEKINLDDYKSEEELQIIEKLNQL